MTKRLLTNNEDDCYQSKTMMVIDYRDGIKEDLSKCFEPRGKPINELKIEYLTDKFTKDFEHSLEPKDKDDDR